ncbi:uncharacterized protein EV154DRAFT_492084 [Mucor mucedo]|uniref:uncharacterized protein n=1 Tax=Mucor mucedo TaxID=29922 RepID=UPI0022208C19|nr:uncharacterized protein EV154DRAFT_492084 [Mucor mucedo]KAI7896391.1 hypothetical protein EV154DRAFT_492084 [Mucor mucedo]
MSDIYNVDGRLIYFFLLFFFFHTPNKIKREREMLFKDFKELSVLRQALASDTEVDFVAYIQSQEIEKKSVFDRHFKRTMQAMKTCFPNAKEGSLQEKMVQWARTVIDNEFEILERSKVLAYWLALEESKFTKNLEYVSLIQLNNEVKLKSLLLESLSIKRHAKRRRVV